MREPEVSECDNGNDHRAAAKVIVPKSRAARGSVRKVLLSDVWLRTSAKWNPISGDIRIQFLIVGFVLQDSAIAFNSA